MKCRNCGKRIYLNLSFKLTKKIRFSLGYGLCISCLLDNIKKINIK